MKQIGFLAGLCVLLALPSSAASLTDVAQPAQIAKAFAPKSVLRVVNLWATWCAPCVAEMDDLRRIDEAYRAKGVQIVGVTLDDAIPGERAETKAKVVRFLDAKKIAFANLYYTGRVPELQDHYRFEGEIPITVIFDANGRELFRHQGKIDRATLAAAIEKRLNAKRR